MPQSHVLQPGRQIAAQHTRQAAQALGQNRIALVGHGRAAFLSWLERLLDLAELAASHVADLRGDLLDGRPDRGTGPEELGMAVAGHDLGGWNRHQAKCSAHMRLDRRVDVGERADST